MFISMLSINMWLIAFADDGSAFYKTHDNFFPFSSGGLKSDFGGHDNHQYRNVYINKGGCMGTCAQLEGHEDQFYNNTCIMSVVGESYANFQTAAGSGGVAKPAMPVMHDNRVYTPDGAVSCLVSLVSPPTRKISPVAGQTPSTVDLSASSPLWFTA